ncbi:MAG: hypothetical protein WCU80_11715 [Paludibacteraceae bacterium]
MPHRIRAGFESSDNQYKSKENITLANRDPKTVTIFIDKEIFCSSFLHSEKMASSSIFSGWLSISLK